MFVQPEFAGRSICAVWLPAATGGVEDRAGQCVGGERSLSWLSCCGIPELLCRLVALGVFDDLELVRIGYTVTDFDWRRVSHLPRGSPHM
jgi:hypothetical protein